MNKIANANTALCCNHNYMKQCKCSIAQEPQLQARARQNAASQQSQLHEKGRQIDRSAVHSNHSYRKEQDNYSNPQLQEKGKAERYRVNRYYINNRLIDESYLRCNIKSITYLVRYSSCLST